ncbi:MULTISPECIES: DUF6420 family protein [Streptomyces]|uniref:DUF6420 family protein n=1 Tax=Streptomyces TaxID=1883 RepID=UPI002FF236A4
MVDQDLPLIHPYAPVTPRRYVTPGGGRHNIRPAEMRAHIRITLDHMGCPAQFTDEKNAAYKRLARAAGLVLEHVDERPDEPATWERVFRLWIRHAATLVRELGDTEAQNMLATAHRSLPLLPGRRAVLLTLRRPAEDRSPRPGVDTMTGPGHQNGGHAMDERTEP